MKNTFIGLLIGLTVLFSINSHADIETDKFQIMLAPAVAKNTAGYGVISNTGDSADTLLNISCDGATVMLHKTEIKSNHAHMHHMKNIIIEANSSLVLEPMSYHLMLSELSDVFFKDRETVTVVFEFKHAGIVEVEVPIVSVFY